MARLLLESGGERREIRISGPVTIGRSPSATFPIDDKTLSREHTRVSGSAGRYVVQDLESKNGTFLNGKLITRPEPLKHGDRVRVGPATFMILWDPEDSAAEQPAPAPRPAATAAPRPGRAHAEAVGGGGVARFFATLIALGVFAAGSWFAKNLYITLLFPRIPQ